jgi:group I intron endonuclease
METARLEKKRQAIRTFRQNHYPTVDIIYGVYSEVHRMIVYIGSTTVTMSERKAKHKYSAYVDNSNRKLYDAMREYGWDNFRFVVLNDEVSEKFTEDYFIQTLRPMFNKQAGLKERRFRV